MFPDACFVVALRDPAEHVASLLKQHRLFCEAESRNRKVLDYMRRCGHFEFGLDRRPINFGDDEAIRRIHSAWVEGDDVKGYAIVWATTYDFVLNLLEKDQALARRVAIVHYGDLCADPGGTLRRLLSHCGLGRMEERIGEQASRIAAPSYYRSEFSERDREVIREETEDVATRFERLEETGSIGI
jgi:hypothetical protein